MTKVLFHIIDATTWDEARELGVYEPPGFATEGFIHLSGHDQILRPANLLYQGRYGLLLLVIDSTALESDVVWEPGSHGEAELFPHLYGPLNPDAVTRTVPFPCEADGTFRLPSGLLD